MDTKQFLEHILPRQGVYMAVGINSAGRLAHIGCATIDEMVAKLKWLEANGCSTYHACASYNQSPYFDENRGRRVCRVKENWCNARALWVDIDCGETKAAEGKGYATQQDAFKAIADFVKTYGFPKPTLVSSGYGVHVYFTLDSDLGPGDWVPMAQTLKDLLVKHGVLADPSRTADFASILRPAGMTNAKDPTNPKQVKVLCVGHTCTSQGMKEHLNKLAQEVLGKLPAIPEYLKGGEVKEIKVGEYQEYKCSAKLCADSCRQVAAMRDTLGDVDYEHWRGVIGLIKFCEEGIELAHEWTAKRAETGHTNLDVDTRYNTWESAPPTCEFFTKCNPDGCEGCQFKGKINTPLVLGRIQETQEPVVMPEPVPETDEMPDEPFIPQSFVWKDGKFMRYVKNKDGILEARTFCNTYFYVVRPIVNEEDDYEFLIQWYDQRNRPHQFQLPSEVIGTGGQKLAAALGAKSITPANDSTGLKDMTAYLRESVLGVMKNADTVRTVTSYGWQSDNSFVIGDRQYSPDGEMRRVLLSGTAKDKASAFPDPIGTLEGYAESLNWLYNREGMEPLQYAICSLWGSLLTPFCDAVYRGIPCVLTGASSGKGKTTSALVGLYCLGDAGQMVVASKEGATHNARMQLLGAFKNLPILFDEMTNMPPNELSALAYSLATGVDRARMQASGGITKMARQLQWSSQCMMTGNTHMTAGLISTGNTEAEAMRLFEIRIDTYDVPTLDPLEVAGHVTELANHMGTAGEAFIKYLVAHRSELAGRIKNVAKRPGFSQKLVIDSKYRFYRYHLACTLTAAEIMKELGVIDFDMTKLFDFAMHAVESLCEEVVQNAPKGKDLIVQLLSDISAHTLMTSVYKPRKRIPRDALPRVQDPVKAQIVLWGGSEEIDPVYDRKVLIYSKTITDWLADNRGMDASVLADQLKKDGVLVEQGKRLTLGPNIIGLPTVQDRCWVLDYEKLAPDLFEENEDE